LTLREKKGGQDLEEFSKIKSRVFEDPDPSFLRGSRKGRGEDPLKKRGGQDLEEFSKIKSRVFEDLDPPFPDVLPPSLS
jgi:hypothetical protein